MRSLIAAVMLLLMVAPTKAADNYRQAWADYRVGKYAVAMKTFKRLANAGNVYSQAFMGVVHAAEHRYTRNKGISPFDPKKTASQIKKLHESGDLEATFCLALMHNEGWGVEKSDVTAKNLYLKAATAGHVVSQTHVAEFYELGVGGQKDIQKAILWYGKAAEHGDIFAISNLKRLKRKQR